MGFILSSNIQLLFSFPLLSLSKLTALSFNLFGLAGDTHSVCFCIIIKPGLILD